MSKVFSGLSRIQSYVYNNIPLSGNSDKTNSFIRRILHCDAPKNDNFYFTMLFIFTGVQFLKKKKRSSADTKDRIVYYQDKQLMPALSAFFNDLASDMLKAVQCFIQRIIFLCKMKAYQIINILTEKA